MPKTATIDPAREAYQMRMQAQIDLWKSDISRLKAKLQLMDANARIDAQRQLQRIEQDYEKVVNEFTRLTKTTSKKWDEVKQTVIAAAEQVRREIEYFR